MSTKAERDKIRLLLDQWGYTDERVEEIESDLDRIRDEIATTMDVHAAPLTGLPRGSDTSDKTAVSAERYARKMKLYGDRIKELEEQKENALYLRAAMDDAMQCLKYRERRVLRLQYEKHMKQVEIANMAHYSVEWVKKTERRAVEKLAKVISFENVHFCTHKT